MLRRTEGQARGSLVVLPPHASSGGSPTFLPRAYLRTLPWHRVKVVEFHAHGPHTRGPHVALAVRHDKIAEVDGLEDGAWQGCNVQNIRDRDICLNAGAIVQHQDVRAVLPQAEKYGFCIGPWEPSDVKSKWR